jgi:hypothetical protein
MLKIIFGDMDNVNYGPYWFKNNYKTEWLQDEFVQEMILDVDKSRYIDGYVIDSPVFGPIPPERLSGGLQTLIVIYKRPDLVFDATSCGQNCAKWLVDIGKKIDVTVNLNYLMHIEEVPGFEVYIENERKTVSSPEDYIFSAVKYV